MYYCFILNNHIRQTDIHTDRQTDEQAGRQFDKQTDRHAAIKMVGKHRQTG